MSGTNQRDYRRLSISQTHKGCTACGATVAAILWDIHLGWHAKQDRQTEELARLATAPMLNAVDLAELGIVFGDGCTDEPPF